jgi:tetratricopeptide (TPR) repeat protein
VSRLIDDLRVRLQAHRVVVVAGSGVTAAATDGDARSSWSGLVLSGLDHASQLPGIQKNILDAAQLLSEAGDSNSLISASELVTQLLGGRDGGEYARWLGEAVGQLELKDPSVPEALVSLGAPVATTNYDGLIEQASGWERVTWLDGSAVQRALQGDDRAVVHLHGHWRTPHSVVLGIRSYEELGHSAPAQALQRAMATMNSLLFVGVGGGASDPNFGALREWLIRTFPDAEYRHYRLCLQGEVDALSVEHGTRERIFPIPYGDRHEDLANFLGDLAEIPTSRLRGERANSTQRGGAIALPAPPVTLGREDEVDMAVGRLLAEPPQPVLLHGAPGIGKTNLTLAVLHHPGIVDRFGERRWLVRCEAPESATGLVGELAAALGISPAGDALAGVLALTSQAPAVLALDNLETPWERDTLAVEELLGVISQIPGVALIASMRGLERPNGVRWARPTQLEPLDQASARTLFTSIAPDDFDTPTLEGLLEEMGGIPLAVELLAYAADGEPDLDHLVKRWQAERAGLLMRGPADHRLLSIAVSIDTSWNSPTMTESAKRLLGVFGRLPDGVADEDLERLLPEDGAAAANLLRRRGLAIEQAGRLRTLPPIRHYLADAHPPSDEDWQRTIDHYRERAAALGALAGRPGGGEAISRLVHETANITVAVKQALDGELLQDGYNAAQGFLEAARFGGIDAGPIAEALVSAAERTGDAIILADVVMRTGDLAMAHSDHDNARSAFERALALYRQEGDVLGEANCIDSLAAIAARRSQHDAAQDSYERALALHRQVGNVLGEANCITALAGIKFEHSEHESAREEFRQALALHQQVGNLLGEVNCTSSIARIAYLRAENDAAREAFQRAQPLYQQLGDVLGEANCISNLGEIALTESQHDGARDAFERALELYRQSGAVLGQAGCITGLGDVALAQADPEGARDAFELALELYQQVGSVLGEANCTRGLGRVALAQDERGDARDAFERAFELYTGIEEPYSVGVTLVNLARLENDPVMRCKHVANARAAWLSIKRDDLVAELDSMFADCR